MSDTDFQFPPSTLQFPEPEPDDQQPIQIDMGQDEPFEDGVEQPDGSMQFSFGEKQKQEIPEDFDANLAEFMSENDLNKIAADLLRGIEDDIASSAQWRDNLALGIRLLGIQIEPQSTDAGTTSTAFEGQHRTTHPLLLEACLTFQANARASLLPASGPVKIRDDQPPQSQQMQPPQPGIEAMGANGGPPLEDHKGGDKPNGQASPQDININVQGANGQQPQQHAFGGSVQPMHYIGPEYHFANGGSVNGYADGGGSPFDQGFQPNGGMNGMGSFAPPQGIGGAPGMMPQQPEPPKTDRDLLSEAMEKDFNHYLTVTDRNYYPDTDRMLFGVGHSGAGVKKIFGCPLKRRPVSESVPVEDFIVSNAFSDLTNMPRITQRVMMRPSVLRRMQLVKAYRDIELADPSDNSTTADEVKQQKADIVGVDISVNETEDLDYEIYECYCELELDDFAPEQFKGQGLPLPYKVVIAKESEKILEIRRNWQEDDQECTAKEYFVDYSYVKAFGWYPIGLMHILGNTTRTLTAAWREFIDAGMFANFPGFVFAKGAGRQLTNNFRVPPGGGVGLDVGLADIRNAVMPLPYKDLTAAFVAFIQHVEEYGQRLGGTANINVGEGKQDSPVGTTLAMIEQATKPLGAVLKRLHSAQAREFQLLKERFKEDPEAFWRFNKRPAMPWRKDQFMQALDDFDLVPVSDPNNPTHMHRMAKASLIFQAAQAAPTLFDQRKVWNRIGDAADIEDPEDLLAPPQSAQPDPKVAAQAASDQVKAQLAQQKSMNDLMIERMRLGDRQQDRASKEKIAAIDRQIEQMRLATTLAIHSSEGELSAADKALQLKQTFQGQQQDADMQQGQVAMDQAAQMHDAEQQRQHDAMLASQQLSHEATQQDLVRAHESRLHHHKVSVDAAVKHHSNTVNADLKRQQIKAQAAAKKSARTK